MPSGIKTVIDFNKLYDSNNWYTTLRCLYSGIYFTIAFNPTFL